MTKGSVDFLFTATKDKSVSKGIPTEEVRLEDLVPCDKHTYSNSSAKRIGILESIRRVGLITPIIVRPHPVLSDKYEMITGHTRVDCLKELGYETVTALVQDIDEEDIIPIMNDSNIQRDKISTMDLARSMSERYNSLKRKVGKPKKDEPTATDPMETICVLFGVKMTNAHRIMSLVNLIPDLQSTIDRKTLSIKAGYIITDIDQQTQAAIGEVINDEGMKVAERDAKAIKGALQGTGMSLTKAEIVAIIMSIQNDVAKEKAPEKENGEIYKAFSSFYPANTTEEQIRADIFHILEIRGKK